MVSTEEAKIALQIGYFLLLAYAMKRGFNLADSFSSRIEGKLDLLIKILATASEKAPRRRKP